MPRARRAQHARGGKPAAAALRTPKLPRKLLNGSNGLTRREIEEVLSILSEGDALKWLDTLQEPDEALKLWNLLGLVLRRQITAPEGVCDTLRTLIIKVIMPLVGLSFRTMEDGEAVLTKLALLVLRTHVLRCEALLLASATTALRTQPSRRAVAAAGAALDELECVLSGLLSATSFRAWGSGPGGRPVPAGGASPSAGPTKQAFLECLKSELAASGLLDAWATCLIELARAGNGGRAERSIRFLTDLEDLCEVLGDCLRGPALSFYLMAYATQFAAGMDGGPTFGLPADLPPLGLITGLAPGSPAAALGGADVNLHAAVVPFIVISRMLLESPALAPGPVPQTALAVVLRVAEASVAYHHHHHRHRRRPSLSPPPASPSVPGAGARSPPASSPPPRLRLHEEAYEDIGVSTLKEVANAILAVGSEGRAVSSAARGRWLPRVWRVVGAMMEAAVGPLSSTCRERERQRSEGSASAGSSGSVERVGLAEWYTTSNDLAAKLMLGADPGLGREPCREVRAMLEGGFLSVYGRILATQTKGMAGFGWSPDVWAQVLAHGPRAEVSSLLRSAAEGLGAAAHGQDGLLSVLQTHVAAVAAGHPAPDAGLDSADFDLAASHYLLRYEALMKWASPTSLGLSVSEPALGASRGASAGGAGEAGVAWRQLDGALSYMVVHMLPLAAGAMRRGGWVAREVVSWRLGKSAGDAAAQLARVHAAQADAVLTWASLGIAALLLAAAEAEAGSEGRRSAAAVRAAEWKAFLLDEVELPCLLAEALHLLGPDPANTRSALRSSLATALRLARAAVPEALRLPPGAVTGSAPGQPDGGAGSGSAVGERGDCGGGGAGRLVPLFLTKVQASMFWGDSSTAALGPESRTQVWPASRVGQSLGMAAAGALDGQTPACHG
ncbi:hypothetical protein HYH03_000234 [Edaphochlamys debaryana]|uniref:Uncharacterized protein n=1 Tax=Edaphochlamys debaryana TaxID=47281 RepID=A0A835YH80_9CHLO|nr:hypothetical protein HYH03_000234 [Edaphochlamys debaryana]|eukprot:KAG2501734.1 hypothetical protein HYH03_000234 [Edaphochlamys debaryana]